MTEINTYPKYYIVDDIPVVLEEIQQGEETIIAGRCANGQPYQIGKAIVDGNEVTKKEYESAATELYGKNAKL